MCLNENLDLGADVSRYHGHTCFSVSCVTLCAPQSLKTRPFWLRETLVNGGKQKEKGNDAEETRENEEFPFQNLNSDLIINNRIRYSKNFSFVNSATDT